MAQNEGRTLRRAPKNITRRIVLFVLFVTFMTGVGLGVHQLKAFAETTLRSPVVAPKNSSPIQAADQGSLQVRSVAHPTQSASPNCTPGQYRMPSVINLTSLPEGVTTIEDSPQTYRIFGDTVDEQRQQLQQCAPVDDFAGAASYRISWQYSYAVRSDGLCRVVLPKIGLHLNMIVPKWNAGPGANESTREAWQTFSKNLSVHEQGHYAISRAHAKAMLRQLQDVPAQSCATIQTSADAVMDTALKALQIAEEHYDGSTDHGATQGALL